MKTKNIICSMLVLVSSLAVAADNIRTDRGPRLSEMNEAMYDKTWGVGSGPNRPSPEIRAEQLSEMEAYKYKKSLEAEETPKSSMAPSVSEQGEGAIDSDFSDESTMTGTAGATPDGRHPTSVKRMQKQEKAHKADNKITKNIRRELMKETSLSTDAQNLNIETTAGRVMVRGTVQSIEEKNRIEEMIRKVSGVKEVDSTQVNVSQ